MTRLIMFLIVATFLNGTVRANAQDQEPQTDTAQSAIEIQVAMADLRAERSATQPEASSNPELFYTPSTMAYNGQNDIPDSDAELVRADGPPVNLRPEDR